MPLATDADRHLDDALLAEITCRLARQDIFVRSLPTTVFDLDDIPTADPIEDSMSARSRADTIAPSDTPINIPVPAARVPAAQPTPLLPDGFLLYDVVAALPQPVVAIDADGRVQLWNPAAAEMFGWHHVDTVGRQVPFVPSERQLEHQRMIAQARAGAVVRETPTVRCTRDGEEVPVIATAAAESGGGVVFSFRRFHPLGPIPIVEPVPTPPPEPVRTSHTRKLETLGRLLTAVAHDFNNVMAVVAGHVELLSDRMSNGATEQESLALIKAAAEHAQGLTRRLLGYSRPSDGTAVPVDLNDAVRGLAKLIRGVAGASVRVILRTPRDAGVVLADPAQIEQVILNLVANAKDAMPEGGTLGVRTSRVVVRPGRSELPAGPYSCVTVSDTGCGVDESTRAKMFDPYFTTKGPLGNGIGLATVREMVTAVRGHVECESDPEFGTVFRVYLPAVPDEEPSASETILLVDDDDAARSFARQVLEEAGYDVIEANGSDEAMRLARVVRGPIGVLVTDVVMPGPSGRKLAETVRAVRPNLPVVFVSGYPPAPGRPSRGTAFVAKPYRADELRTAVRRALRSAAPVATR